MRKMISFSICLSLLFSLISYSSVGAQEKTKEIKAQESFERISNESPLVNVDGTVEGTRTFDIQKTTIQKPNITIIKTKTDIYDKVDGMITKVNTFEDTFEYFKNGMIKVNNQFVSTDIQNELAETAMVASLASGGKTYLTHYKETSTDRFTLKAYKTPTNFMLDGGAGTPRYKYGVRPGYMLTDFKSLARSVATARDNIQVAALTLSGAGVALLWATILTGIGGAGAIGIASLTIYLNSRSAKSDMLEAYNLL